MAAQEKSNYNTQISHVFIRFFANHSLQTNRRCPWTCNIVPIQRWLSETLPHALD
jgi:hypothetical protein